MCEVESGVMLKALLSAVTCAPVKVPPLQTMESLITEAAIVSLRSGSVNETEPLVESAPEPSVMEPVTTTGVSTGASLVPTMVTVTVEWAVPPWPSATEIA